MANVNNETLLLIFVACTGAAVLLQAFVLLAMYFAMRKGLKMAQAQIEELRTNIFPVVRDTKDLLTRIGPKVEAVTTDFAAITRGIRTQGALMKVSATDIVERVNRQASRLDVMLTGVLDAVDRASAVVIDVINVPLRQLSAVTAFAKAAVGTLRTGPPQPGPTPQPTHAAADKDLFV